MIHYHGTPITPREKLYELAGRHFCVSYAEPRDVKVCHEIGQSVMLDNGAYSIWRNPRRSMDWEAWADWVQPWLEFPTTWAVLPDVIDGDEFANDHLASMYAWVTDAGAPVWHLHESLDRLERLCDLYARVCFGSSGAYSEIGTDRWHRRISEAFDRISSPAGRVPWIHMLRGLALAGSHYPFASADSVNAARNHSGSWRQRARPITEMVAEVDARQCPALWHRRGVQTEMEVA